MEFKLKSKNNYLIILILLVATILRFYNYFELPYTHDELSAILRTRYSSFSDLINLGVKTDNHPAGMQIFLYYWIRIFGEGEQIVKLPYILFGLASIFVFYLVAKKWSNQTVALLSASTLASTQYFIMYSQMARFYISGLFFILMMVYFWHKIIFESNKTKKADLIFYIFFASLSTYNHYFSLLFTFIIGITGLFFIKKDNLVKYLIINIIVVLLFLPHFNIFMLQLEREGLSWVSVPKSDYILNYLFFSLNYSWLSVLTLFSIIAYGFVRYRISFKNTKFVLISLFWFLIPFLVAYYYSIYVSPIIQFSVLIFSFPFILVVIFRHIPEQNFFVNLFFVALILLVNTYSLINTRHHYQIYYKTSFEHLVTDMNKNNIPTDAIRIVNTDEEKYSRFYIDKHDLDTTSFVWYSSFESKSDFILFLDQNESEFLYYACASSSESDVIPIIMNVYPNIIEQNDYFTGNTYLFSKIKSDKTHLLKNISSVDFENNITKWTSINMGNIVDSVSYSQNHSYIMKNDVEWGPTFELDLESIIENRNNFIDFSCKIKLIDSLYNIEMITSLIVSDTNVYWRSNHFNNYITSSNKSGWINLSSSIKMSDIHLQDKDAKLKVYIWNKGKSNFYIDDLSIKLRKGNPIVYGLYENFNKSITE